MFGRPCSPPSRLPLLLASSQTVSPMLAVPGGLIPKSAVSVPAVVAVTVKVVGVVGVVPAGMVAGVRVTL